MLCSRQNKSKIKQRRRTEGKNAVRMDVNKRVRVKDDSRGGRSMKCRVEKEEEHRVTW